MAKREKLNEDQKNARRAEILKEMKDNVKLSREDFNLLNLKSWDAWLKEKHPEIKEEWININKNKFFIPDVLPERKKRVKTGEKIITGRKDKVEKTVSVYEYVDYNKEVDKPRKLTKQEVFEWVATKYGMMPDKVEEDTFEVGEW